MGSGSRKKKGAFYRWVQSPEINKRFSEYFEPGSGIEGELFELYKVQSLEVRPIRYINSGGTLSVRSSLWKKTNGPPLKPLTLTLMPMKSRSRKRSSALWLHPTPLKRPSEPLFPALTDSLSVFTAFQPSVAAAQNRPSNFSRIGKLMILRLSKNYVKYVISRIFSGAGF